MDVLISHHATHFADMNAVLDELAPPITVSLGDRLVGIYLHGSLATGDFDPTRSDIDLIVVTDGDLPEATLTDLCAVHERFATSDSPWAVEVEVSYLPRDILRRDDPERHCHPRVERGAATLALEDHPEEWLIVQRHVLRERGVTLAGPPPHALIDPVSPGDLQRAARLLAATWLPAFLADPTPQLHRGYQVYVVLTVCRLLYTLDTGAVASKQAAARWAKEALGERWRHVINSALAWTKPREGVASTTAGDADVRDTLELVRSAMGRFSDLAAPADNSRDH
jgi:hypothetical protein